ncbi:MAG: hypothetical protein AB7I98_14550 [Verrucomicrobiales bacterium]|nr:hypothetical protein [Verrucomicrobiae bacterium]MCP5552795.1 hypothetical protein [Akkermansiaceae bacterium]
MKIRLIDAIGPFFQGYNRQTINWSKIPFDHLALRGPDREIQWDRIRASLRTLGLQAASWGFTAASLDDVAHLVDDEHYEPEVREAIGVFREEFRRCIAVLRECGLEVFVTMDVMSTTPALRNYLGNTWESARDHLRDLLERFLTDFPEVKAVILRIGESDGKDVKDFFHSRLLVKKPWQARELLEALLPVFERHGRWLIFRTWTVGAYRIGDLMWHRRTLADVFDRLTSPALIVSMKYGESDFFRFLPLNKSFFYLKQPKMLELQSRREYEGCGEYPSFTGWEYEAYVRELRQARDVVGVSIWCQTGGWVPFRRLAFLEPAAFWIDLNTFVSLRVVADGWLVEEAVRAFAEDRGLNDWRAFLQLLRLSDDVIRELLYLPGFARQKLYFRRVRIPPLLHVYWHNIFISHSAKKLLSHFTDDPETALRAALVCQERLNQMRTLASKAGAPVADLEYMEDTFRFLALAREYYFRPESEAVRWHIRDAKRAYKLKYPKDGDRPRYRIKTDYEPLLVKPRYLGWVCAVFMRRRRGYRIVDRILTLHLLSIIYRVVARRRPHWIPEFARDSAMGVDVVFK